jgi:hypothetical protein
MINTEQITVNEGQQVATGYKKDGSPWKIFVYQTSVGECKSFNEIAAGTQAMFETEVRAGKPYKGVSKQEKWINKFVGAVEGVKVGQPLRTGQAEYMSNPAAVLNNPSPQAVFTEEDRQMIRETFEMVKSLFDHDKEISY